MNASDPDLPLIDIFLNPQKEIKKERLIQLHQDKTGSYYSSVDMEKLYPALFKLLWFSSLPCSQQGSMNNEYMIKSCEVAGEIVDCENFFSKVPTDVGM